MRIVMALLLSCVMLLAACDNGLSFADPALDACVRSFAPGGGHLTQKDLDEIKQLFCGNPGGGTEPDPTENIVRLDGIEMLRNLEELHLGVTHISDLSPLRHLEKLKEMGIHTDRKINSYVPLCDLRLTGIGISGAELEDINFLANIPTLERLYLEDNKISDISVIKQLPVLTSINVSENKVTTLEPIAKHPNIANFTEVSVSYNCIDCAAEAEYKASIKENSDISVFCSSEEQFLPGNCSE